ncbi:MAG: hypothetical protein R2873_13135 [Caldilineaceae bacterium]
MGLFLIGARTEDQSGELLRMDGTVQDSVGIGYSIDYENDDQIGMGLALKPTGDPAMADYA